MKMILVLSFLAATLSAAEKSAFSFPRSSPEAQGIASSAILDFVEGAEAKVDALHSFMVVRHGCVVAEGWWSPYEATKPHLYFSLSKSFTSTAVGLAIADGKLTLDDPVLKFFPEEAPSTPSTNLKAMRIRDLLSMSAGHHESDIKSFPFGSDQDLVKAFFALQVAHKPGTHFVYNTPGSYMLFAIVQKVTGQTVLDYLKPRLFEPLGIEDPQWETSAQGISLGGYGLRGRTEDIARFGQLYLQKGKWNGQQLIPASWVELATARQTSNGSSPESDWEQGYGYQFWRCRHGFYRGDGAFGQFCIVMPEYDAVVAITSGTKNMGSVMNLVWDRIVPALQKSALPENAPDQEKLRKKLLSLALVPCAGAMKSTAMKSFVGKRYLFPSNATMLKSIALDSANEQGDATLLVNIADTQQRIVSTSGKWQKSQAIVGPAMIELVAVSGGWIADDVYQLKVCRYLTPFITTYTLHFSGGELSVDTIPNVGFDTAPPPSLIGRIES